MENAIARFNAKVREDWPAEQKAFLRNLVKGKDPASCKVALLAAPSRTNMILALTSGAALLWQARRDSNSG